MSLGMSDVTKPTKPNAPQAPEAKADDPSAGTAAKKPAGETGGPKGPEPTRFGDWERNGRCVDF